MSLPLGSGNLSIQVNFNLSSLSFYNAAYCRGGSGLRKCEKNIFCVPPCGSPSNIHIHTFIHSHALCICMPAVRCCVNHETVPQHFFFSCFCNLWNLFLTACLWLYIWFTRTSCLRSLTFIDSTAENVSLYLWRLVKYFSRCWSPGVWSTTPTIPVLKKTSRLL